MEELIGKTIRLRSYRNQQHILAKSAQNDLITMITDHDHSGSEIMERTSFVMVPGLVGGAGTVSFRPMKSLHKYIRVKEDKLYVEGMIYDSYICTFCFSCGPGRNKGANTNIFLDILTKTSSECLYSQELLTC